MPQQEPYVPGRLLSFADQVFEEHPSPPIPPVGSGHGDDLGDDDPLEP
ncbi:MAG: hypothetical protein Q7S16_00725 [bacterium]|nr:hypothetical protein [bacterium]